MMDDLVLLYLQKFNLLHAKFQRIDHDDAIVAIVYKIVLDDGSSFILKICPQSRHYFRELYGLKTFAKILPVARVIQVIAPEKNFHGAILMKCLPGELGSSKNLTVDVAYHVGQSLAKIHTVRTDGYGELIEINDLGSNAYFYFKKKLVEVSLECEKYISKELLQNVDNYFQNHQKLFMSIDGPCITHRDFRAGNILIHEGKLSGIIDWAGIYSGFAEEDFVPLEHHNEWPMDASKKQAFLDGYSSVRPIPNYLNILPLLQLKKALEILGFIIKTNSVNCKNSQLYLDNYDFLQNFFNKG